MTGIVDDELLHFTVIDALKPLELLLADHSLCSVLHEVDVLNGDAESLLAILFEDAGVMDGVRNAWSEAIVLVADYESIGVVADNRRHRDERVDL